MKVGSLFSGIGGLDLGLERAGMTVRWQIENDPWCQQILAKHWPDVPRYGDIHDINPNNLEPVDLICGGFPCQPVSLAGARKAEDDDRWLWPEYFRIVRTLRPRYVVVENVPGLASAGMGDVLGDLAAVGYDTEWQSVPAAAVGAPHLRWRIFIVAYPAGNSCDGEKHEPGQKGSRKAGLSQQPRGGSLPVADTDSIGRNGRPRIFRPAGWRQPPHSSQWGIEPDVDRVADGIPRRVDRLRGLGNAVVPQVAEWVGRQIMEAQW